MSYPVIPPNQSLNTKDYKHVVVVFGSRTFTNKKQFDDIMKRFVKRFKKEELLFISGAASRGPDAMIIDWAYENGYPCKQVPADWLSSPKGAGFIRNREMARLCTEGLGLWDRVSNGTRQMIDCLTALTKDCIVVNTDPEIGDICALRQKNID